MGLKSWLSKNVRKAPSERSDHVHAKHNAQRQTPAEDAPVAGGGPDQATGGFSGPAVGGGARG